MMNQETYDYVLEILSREPSFSEGIRQLKNKWPTVFESVSEKTLKSIQAQYYVRRMRRNHHHHYSRDTREKYYKLYKDAKSRNEKNVIMRLASKNDISPCLLARIILEEYYWNDVDHGRDRERGDSRGSLPPGFMTDCIRDIAQLPNPELANEIYETIVLDNFYGPAVDSIKKCCGAEYEMILKSRCKEAGFSIIDEGQMRDEGYDKTPDIKLKVPIMINCRVVNWIESKASFGDPINHQQYMIDQYLPYKNRFGPGAVIYWFGFVKELAETGERSILLLSSFPEAQQITHLRDVHEQEKDSINFRFNLDTNVEADSDHYCGLGSDGRDQFYNYVDPMFDSDEEDVNLPDVSIANVKLNCGYSNVSSESNSVVVKTCDMHHGNTECSCSLENAMARVSLDNVHVCKNINFGKSGASVISEDIMQGPVNTIYHGCTQLGCDGISCTCPDKSTCEVAADIFIGREKLPHIKNSVDISSNCDLHNNVNSDILFVNEELAGSLVVYGCDRHSSCDRLGVAHDCSSLSCSSSTVRANCPEVCCPELSLGDLKMPFDAHDCSSLSCSASTVRANCPEVCCPELSLSHLKMPFDDSTIVVEESKAVHSGKQAKTKSSSSSESRKKNKKKTLKRNR